MVYPDLRFKPRLAVLSEEQIEQIHLATLEVLERTGVEITHPRAVEILHGGGARVEGKRVRLPGWMVEDAIRTAPSRVVLGTRDGERTVFLEGDKVPGAFLLPSTFAKEMTYDRAIWGCGHTHIR